MLENNKYRSVEDTKVWKEAIILVKEIYSLCQSSDRLSKDFSLRDQIQRASISIPSNIAEGYERGTK
jgi:four helix bundle protein